MMVIFATLVSCAIPRSRSPGSMSVCSWIRVPGALLKLEATKIGTP